MKRNLQNGDLEVVGYIVDKEYRCLMCSDVMVPNGYTPQPIFAVVAREYNIKCNLCKDPLEVAVFELSR